MLDAEDDYDGASLRGDDAALLGDAAPAVKAVPGDIAGIMMEAAQDVGGGGPTGRGVASLAPSSPLRC